MHWCVCVCAVQLPSNLVWAMLSAGWEHSCGVTSASEGHCWGKSSYGQTTVPSGHSWSSISAGRDHTCGVTTLAEGYCWGGGNQYGRNDVPPNHAWKMISAGRDHTCGVTTLGEGYMNRPAPGRMPSTAPCVCALRTTCDRCVLCSCLCALCSTRYCWGDVGSGYDRTTVPSGYTWSSISAGVFHTCGVTTAGEGHCWGRNENGMATVPSGYTWATDFAMISPSPPPAPPASPPPPPPPPPALVSVESGGNLHITEGGSLQIGGE